MSNLVNAEKKNVQIDETYMIFLGEIDWMIPSTPGMAKKVAM